MPNYDTYNALMPITDKISKRIFLIPGYEIYMVIEQNIIIVRIFFLYDQGFPTGIISNRDRKFISVYQCSIWKVIGIRLLIITAYYPTSNGIAERKNQTVEIAICFYAFYYELGYNQLLIIPLLQQDFNNAFVESIKVSSYKYLFGYKFLGLFDVIISIADYSL